VNEAELIAAVDDPATREVYADWLEQRGDPRAELVRIAVDAWKEPIDLLRVRRLFARRAELDGVGDLAWRLRIARPPMDEIRRRVGVLASLGVENQTDWKLHPPIDAAKLAELEQRIGVQLPAQYRRFVTELADGAPGPEKGIEPIADLRDSSLAQPFPLDTINVTPEDEDESVEDTLTGAWIFCKGDYTTLYWLVFAGPDAGVVWMSTHHGWTPLRADGTWAEDIEGHCKTPRENRVEFIDWYVQWLDEKLWDLARETPDGDNALDREPSEVIDLNLGDREFTVVPEKLRGMTLIKKLSFESTPITELPPWIGELTKLEMLILTKTALRTLPDELCDLPNLRHITCFGTKTLERLPERIGRMPQLRYLNLQYCGLVELPASIVELPIGALQINANRLTTLPASIGRLRMTDLDLRGNCITALPDEIIQCGIVELSLMENELTALPPVLGRMPDLEVLVLDGNRGLDLPGACKILANAPKLRKLSLNSMSLDKLPDELALLTQVRSLGLSFNRLSDIEVLAKMPNLAGIDVVCSGADGMGSKVSDRFYSQRDRTSALPDD
jgi:uncharacterized protein (TIGR02996 family)